MEFFSPFLTYNRQLLAETAILVLQIANHIQRRKQFVALKTPILSTLFRDGYLYFFAIMSIRLMAILIVSADFRCYRYF
jgi:hypothetical protein